MSRKKRPREEGPSRMASGRSPRPYAAVAVLLLAGAGGGLWLWSNHRGAPSLLLITIDTLRADRVGCYGYAGATTPVLDGLARRGARFARAEAAVPLTGPSHATILTGLYPPVHGVRDNVTFPLGPQHPTLATILKSAGYDTAAFVGAYPVAADFGFGRGFDHFDDSLHPPGPLSQGAERPGNEVADAALRWLSAHPEGPFFVWAHFYDPHAPYAPPHPFRETFRDRPYDGEVAFVDVQIGRLLDALKAQGRDKDTLLAIVADHGEGLGDHGEATHGVLVYESTLHVPWILAGPGIPSGRVIDERVATAELLPTVLRLLKQKPPSGLLSARDLSQALKGASLPREALYSESLFGRLNCRWSTLRAITSGEWKLILGKEPELFHLAEDPGETHNLAGQERDRAARLQETLRAALTQMAPRGDAARPVAISAEQEERLRSLGYAAGGGGGGSLDEPGLPDPRTHVALFERLQDLSVARGGGLSPAIEEAEQIVGRDPQNPFAHFTLATLAHRAGDLQGAARAYARTLDLDPERPALRENYGRVLRDLGRLPESERHLRIALTQSGEGDLRAKVSLAETLVASKNLDEAANLLEDVLRREPKHALAHRALGHLLMAQGRAADAIEHFEKAVRERDPEPWIDMAQAFLLLGQPKRAGQAAEQVLARNPGHPWALAVSGHALVLDGRLDEGRRRLDQALSLRPRRPEVWMALASAFEAAGDRPAAARCRKEAATPVARPVGS